MTSLVVGLIAGALVRVCWPDLTAWWNRGQYVPRTTSADVVRWWRI